MPRFHCSPVRSVARFLLCPLHARPSDVGNVSRSFFLSFLALFHFPRSSLRKEFARRNPFGLLAARRWKKNEHGAFYFRVERTRTSRMIVLIARVAV